jgi:hypothetical protein
VALAAILFDKYKDRSLATMGAVITFTSAEEAVEVFGKVVMRGSCRVNGLERL